MCGNDSAHLAASCLTHCGGFEGLEGSAPGSAIIALFYIRRFTRNVCGLTYSDTHTLSLNYTHLHQTGFRIHDQDVCIPKGSPARVERYKG